MDNWYKAGLAFSCTQCHACCRHDPGYVFLSQVDIEKLSNHLTMTIDAFKKAYCRVVDFGFVTRLSLTETAIFDCIFWKNGCTVYEARPLQCRSYPFWSGNLHAQDRWQEEAQDCPGMNKGTVHTHAVIEAWLSQREKEKLLEG